MKPLAEAQRRVLGAMAPLPIERVPLAAAAGLVLVEPADAPHDVPPFTNSAMDGFAVRAADLAAAPVDLVIVEDVPAGSVPALPVGPGQAARIMTGAPMPEGADTVVMVEATSSSGDRVHIGEPVPAGASVRAAGSDVASGERVFAVGTRLGPTHLGLLAAIGISAPMVRRRPRVAVLSTGSEVMPAETGRLAVGAIRDANRPLLMAMIAEAGAEAVDFGIVPDDAALLRSTLGEAAATCDAVLTSGGVSMGDYDLVKQVLAETGSIEFWRVAMQPAKPFAFGLLGETPLFGLPGNPVSVTVAFEQFVRPALLHRMGARLLFRPRIVGVLDEAVETDPAKIVFLRVIARYAAGEWRVGLSGGQSSHELTALAAANAFAVIPVGTGGLAAGEQVELEMFRWPEARTAEEVLGWTG
ncbi:MAG: molybdopterin molybdotransferase MoeA [Actinobacteria bacterium]|nr:molybdopterin molybdotransferase MoeA [Actinomycetota bacterium]